MTSQESNLDPTFIEDDELLEEIDVCYNGELEEEIFIMQYPLRPSDKSYSDHAELTNLMVNRENFNMKLSYQVESKMKNFDTQYFENKNFSQTLQGQKIDPNTNYCLGVFKNNILFLNPISKFIQFRNDFSHMETAEANKKKGKDKMSVTTSRKDSINVSVSSLGSNLQNFSNASSSTQEELKMENYKFYKKDTIQSYQINDKLSFDDNIKMSKPDFISEDDYYTFFFSNVNREILNYKSTSIQFSYQELMNQPLHIRIEYFIKKLNLMSFNSLKNICNFKKENINENLFLEMCLKYARILKNGNLILKSEIRYENLTEKSAKRNYLINLLQNYEGLKKSEIKFLEVNEINEMLGEIAKSQGGLYHLKEDEMDGLTNLKLKEDFINTFRNAYELEMKFWNSNYLRKSSSEKPLNIIIGDKKNELINLNLEKNNSQNEMIVDGDDNLGYSKNGYGTTYEIDNKDTTINNIEQNSKFNIDLIKNTLKRNFSGIDCIYLNNLLNKLNKELNIDNNSEEDKQLLQKTINEIIKSACYINDDVCFLKDIGEGNALILRKTLIEFLISKKSAKKNEIKNHIQSVNLEVPDNLLNKVLKSIGIYGSSVWSLKEPTE